MSEKVSGLRKMADFLEENPEFERHVRVGFFQSVPAGVDGGEKAFLGRFLRAASRSGAEVHKGVEGQYYDVTATWDGVILNLFASRERVCEKKLVGTKKVTKSIPDPNVEVPYIEVEEEEHEYEYECGSLLEGADDAV